MSNTQLNANTTPVAVYTFSTEELSAPVSVVQSNVQELSSLIQTIPKRKISNHIRYQNNTGCV